MKLFLRILISIAAVVGIVFAGSLIKYSNGLLLPEKYVYVSSSSAAYDYPWIRNTGAKYLGGDAYNFIVEASLKAGYYNAVSDEKAITKVGGLTLLFISIFTFLASLCSVERCLSEDRKLSILQSIAVNTKPSFNVPTGDGAAFRPIDLAEMIGSDAPEADPEGEPEAAAQPEPEEEDHRSDTAAEDNAADIKVTE